MQKWYLLSIFTLCCFSLAAQTALCGGNIGDNLFDDGDFGAGSPNVYPTNPNIAPGYIYKLTPPPNDGQYVLTNSSANWAYIFPSWLQIPDNSTDPKGYMMVVNASYTPGLFYDKQIDGLCENTTYEFSADIINMIRPSVGGHIKPNVTFLIDNTAQFTTGEVPQDAKWHTYGFTFSTAPGQTSVRLSLRNNAPGGVGNDLALDNISFSPCGPQAYINGPVVIRICEDGQPIELGVTIVGNEYNTPTFQWQHSLDKGNSWQDIPGVAGPVLLHTQLTAGDYYYRFLLANGPDNLLSNKCRIVSDIKIVRVEPLEYQIVDTICVGASYITASNEYTAAGIYVDSLISTIGCDSIVTLDLRLIDDTNIALQWSQQAPSCHGDQDGQILIENLSGGVPPLKLSLNGVQANSPLNFFNLSAGNYNLRVTDRFLCSFAQTVILQDPVAFELHLGPDLDLVFGDPAILSVQSNLPIAEYYWTPVGVVNCPPDCQPILWYPFADGAVVLEALTAEGCLAADTVQLRVKDERQLYIPTAFSPNDDGINDVFTVYGQAPAVQAVERLQVFDRWGNLVFDRSEFPPNSDLEGWDGRYKGKYVSPAVYVYLAEVRYMDGLVKKFSGTIALVR